MIHPCDDRVEVAAANHVAFTADVQSADKSHQPGFKASFDDRILFAVGPRRAGLRACADDGGTSVRGGGKTSQKQTNRERFHVFSPAVIRRIVAQLVQ